MPGCMFGCEDPNNPALAGAYAPIEEKAAEARRRGGGRAAEDRRDSGGRCSHGKALNRGGSSRQTSANASQPLKTDLRPSPAPGAS